jgi:glutathione S-transferase
MRAREIVMWAVGLTLLMAPLVGAQSDDPFLRSLSDDQEVDRVGLARFMTGIGSTLAAGKDSVAYMKLMAEGVVPGEQFKAKAADAIQQRFSAYEQALEDFRDALVGLQARPRSDRLLFAALSAGQHSCWRLESHINLAESYGAAAGQLRGVLASGAACSKFAHVVFQPKVTALIEQALADGRDESSLSRDNRELREELAALEQLLQDLREIDAK